MRQEQLPHAEVVIAGAYVEVLLPIGHESKPDSPTVVVLSADFDLLTVPRSAIKREYH